MSQILNAEQRLQLLTARIVLARGLSDSSDSKFASEGLALLALHDAAELFLRVAGSYFSITHGSKQFEKLLDAVAEAAKASSLPMPLKQTELRALNSARNAFKHHGVAPQKSSVKQWAIDVQTFLYVASATLLGIELGSVSLADLVQNAHVANYLKAAEGALWREQFDRAMEFAFKAFRLIQIDSYSVPTHSARRNVPYEAGDKLARNVDIRLESVEFKMDLVEHGIALQEYRRFRTIAPRFNLSAAGTWAPGVVTKNATREKAAFCVAFAIDASLLFEKNRVLVPKDPNVNGSTWVHRLKKAVSATDRTGGHKKEFEIGDFLEIHYAGSVGVQSELEVHHAGLLFDLDRDLFELL